MTAAGESPPPTMRERYRTQVRHEVKQAALAQLAQAGPAAVSISAIGKQLGVSGPALYRYFASRDELLTELAIDAYHDLADALTAASRQVSAGASRPEGQASPTRFEAAARAYRSWARPAAPVPAAVRAAAARLRRPRAAAHRRGPGQYERPARRPRRARGQPFRPAS